MMTPFRQDYARIVGFLAICPWVMVTNRWLKTEQSDYFRINASALENHISKAFFHIRSWSYTEDAKHLESAKGHLQELQQTTLPQTMKLAQAESDAGLEKACVSINKSLQDYASIVDKTEATVSATRRLMEQRIASASAFMKSATEFEAGQRKDALQSTDPAERERHQQRQEIALSLIHRGYAIRLDIFIAQDAHDTARLHDLKQRFAAMTADIDHLLSDHARDIGKHTGHLHWR